MSPLRALRPLQPCDVGGQKGVHGVADDVPLDVLAVAEGQPLADRLASTTSGTTRSAQSPDARDGAMQ